MATRVNDVARFQRLLLLAILGQILVSVFFLYFNVAAVAAGQAPGAAPASMGIALALNLAAVAVTIATIVLLTLLMVALGRRVVSMVLAAIAMFIPLINLIVLVVVNQRATSTLRAAGYRVGLLGARR